MGANIGTLLEGVLNPILGSITAAGLRDKTPTPPDFRQMNPRGQPGGRNAPDFRMQPTGPDVARELGMESWPGQVGPDFVSQQHLQDIARDFKDQKDRRSLEESALGQFTRSFDQGMQRFQDNVSTQFGTALKDGSEQFGDAIAAVTGQYANADQALSASIKSLSASLKSVEEMRINTLAAMETAKGEFMFRLIEDNAAAVAQQVLQMDTRGRMEYEELAGELAASGLPMFQQQNLKHKFRLGISKDIGDTVSVLQFDHAKWRNDKEREWDSEITKFRSDFALASAQITATTATEVGGAFSKWADSKQRTAFAEADIRTGFAEWRSGIASNWGMLESQISAHNFAGRIAIAEQMRSLTIPTYRLGILADAQLAYQNNEAQVEWQNSLALFGIQSGIDTFELQGWQNGFASIAEWQATHEAESRADARADSANMFGLGSSLIGAGGAIGAAALIPATGGTSLAAGAAATA